MVPRRMNDAENISFNRDKKENLNSDFSIKRELTPPYSEVGILEELTRP